MTCHLVLFDRYLVFFLEVIHHTILNQGQRGVTFILFVSFYVGGKSLMVWLVDRFYNPDISKLVFRHHSPLPNYSRLFVTTFPIFPLFFVSENEGV
jgi:hypothetical protein